MTSLQYRSPLYSASVCSVKNGRHLIHVGAGFSRMDRPSRQMKKSNIIHGRLWPANLLRASRTRAHLVGIHVVAANANRVVEALGIPVSGVR
jgi:hypothetical protein